MPGGSNQPGVFRRAFAVLAAVAVGALLCTPLGAASYFSLVADHQCACGETAAGDAEGYVFVGAVASFASFVLGSPVWWLTQRRWTERTACLVAALTLGASPFVTLSVVSLANFAGAPISAWLVLPGAGIFGLAISALVWVTAWTIGGRRSVPSPPSNVFE